MGRFFRSVLFPGGVEPQCRSAVQKIAENPTMNIWQNLCHWHLYKNGPAVLLNDGYCGYAYMARRLSAMLPCHVMVLFTYDDDYWGYFLWRHKAECDHFHSCPDYFGPGLPPRKPGNAALIAQTFGVERQAIERYLQPWEKAKSGHFDNGGCSDFMAALGFDFGLLEEN